MEVVFFLVFASFAFAQDNNINNIIANSGILFDEYEVVPKSVLTSIEGMIKCGEGVLKNKFVCVPYYNCDTDTNTVIATPNIDGATKIDIRSIFFKKIFR